ncbi:MAG: MFS transporter [Planctomycetaceae bacterium]
MPPAAEVSSPLEEASIYTREFWLAYAANLALVSANSLTFRFADYVAFFGGSKTLTGWIVQSGLVAAILFRLVLGRAIDRYGPRKVWLTSSSLLFLGCASHLAATSVAPWLWIARIAQQLGIAGMFTCSIVNIQDQVPPQRRTEVIGSLGSSGFIGTILGTNLGDLIFQLWPGGQTPFLVTFGTTLLGGILHTLLVLELTREEHHEAPPEFVGPLKLLFHYWPGPVLLVSMAMGTSFAVTTVFLSRYVSATGLGGIAPFFLPYSITAFTCRWYLRDWGARVGRHRMVQWGLVGLTLGQLLFLVVRSDVWLVIPGAVCGFGHALLFPAVVSLGSGRFPAAYRGTGTTLILGFQEVGLALSAPLLGMLIDWGNQWNTDGSLIVHTGELAHAGTWGYLAMFVASALSAGLTAVFYSLTAARHPDRDPVLGPVQGMMNPQPDEN